MHFVGDMSSEIRHMVSLDRADRQNIKAEAEMGEREGSGESMFVSENETGDEVTSDGKREERGGEREGERAKDKVRHGVQEEFESYHVNEALLDPVQCGSQSAADEAQTR